MHPSDEDSDHARKVKRFVRDYARAQDRCHGEYRAGDENRANAAIDEMKRLERGITFAPGFVI